MVSKIYVHFSALAKLMPVTVSTVPAMVGAPQLPAAEGVAEVTVIALAPVGNSSSKTEPVTAEVPVLLATTE